MHAQSDIFRDSPAARAQRFRIAAETERNNPYFTPDERERRAAYYEQQAEACEREGCR
jgi:hypothetical protein